MYKLKLLSILLLPLVFFSGCLKVETTVKVNKDGSGTITEQLLLSNTFASMLKDLAGSFGDSSNAQEFSVFNEKELKEKNYGEGVVYKSGEKIETNGWQGYKAVYSFSDVSNIKLSPNPDDKISLGLAEGNTGDNEESYFFRFTKGRVSELTIERPEFYVNNEADENAESKENNSESEASDEFLNMMKGMSILVNIDVGGDIVETNATYVDGSKITMLKMDFSELLKNKDAVKMLKKNRPDSIAELKEFFEKFPGVKLELKKPIIIKFK